MGFLMDLEEFLSLPHNLNVKALIFKALGILKKESLKDLQWLLFTVDSYFQVHIPKENGKVSAEHMLLQE
jgi:hypothetical protein